MTRSVIILRLSVFLKDVKSLSGKTLQELKKN